MHRNMSILVLEDDDSCSDLTRNILQAAGFDVICARNFFEAIDPVENGSKIDLALVDVKMPLGTPNGISFARLAQARRPSLKVIFMSATMGSREFLDYDAVFLHKPLIPHHLIEAVTRAVA